MKKRQAGDESLKPLDLVRSFIFDLAGFEARNRFDYEWMRRAVDREEAGSERRSRPGFWID